MMIVLAEVSIYKMIFLLKHHALEASIIPLEIIWKMEKKKNNSGYFQSFQGGNYKGGKLFEYSHNLHVVIMK